MAKVLVVVDDGCVDLPSRARALLGDGHQYKVMAVAPDHRSPFLNEDTVSSVQAEADSDYGAIAQHAAEPVRAPAEVRAGDPAVEVVAAAGAERADMVVMQAHRPRLWRRLTGQGVVDHLLGHAPCAVLLVPPRRSA